MNLRQPVDHIAGCRPQELAQEPSLAPSFEPTPSSEPQITLDDLVRRVTEKSLQATVAREGVEAARQRLNARGASPSPYVLLVPALGNRAARDEEAILAQPLDVFGLRRIRVAVAQAELRRAQTQLTLAERALLTQVKSAAVGLFAAQEAESLSQAQVEVAQAFLKAVQRRAELGEAPAVQAERAELELLRAQNEWESARADRLVRRVTLNTLIGQEPQSPLRLALPVQAPLLEPLRRTLPPAVFPGVGLSGNTSGNTPPGSAPLPNTPAVTPPNTSAVTPSGIGCERQ